MVHLYHLFVAATSFLAIVPSAFAIPTIEKREVHPVQSLFERIQTFHEVTTSVPAPWDANQYFRALGAWKSVNTFDEVWPAHYEKVYAPWSLQEMVGTGLSVLDDTLNALDAHISIVKDALSGRDARTVLALARGSLLFTKRTTVYYTSKITFRDRALNARTSSLSIDDLIEKWGGIDISDLTEPLSNQPGQNFIHEEMAIRLQELKTFEGALGIFTNDWSKSNAWTPPLYYALTNHQALVRSINLDLGPTALDEEGVDLAINYIRQFHDTVLNGFKTIFKTSTLIRDSLTPAQYNDYKAVVLGLSYAVVSDLDIHKFLSNLILVTPDNKKAELQENIDRFMFMLWDIHLDGFMSPDFPDVAPW